jgi:hypothetical protein
MVASIRPHHHVHIGTETRQQSKFLTRIKELQARKISNPHTSPRLTQSQLKHVCTRGGVAKRNGQTFGTHPEVDWAEVGTEWLVPILIVRREEEKPWVVCDLLIRVLIRLVN